MEVIKTSHFNLVGILSYRDLFSIKQVYYLLYDIWSMEYDRDNDDV